MLQLGVKVEQQAQKIARCYVSHIIEQKEIGKNTIDLMGSWFLFVI
jgi:hypothetical protein